MNFIWTVILLFQVLGVAWKPSQFKPAEEQTSCRRSWTGNIRSADEESRGCRCCANNEESQCCRRTTVVINTFQELVFCQIPWRLRPFLLIFNVTVNTVNLTPVCNNNKCPLASSARLLHPSYLTSPPPCQNWPCAWPSNGPTIPHCLLRWSTDRNW